MCYVDLFANNPWMCFWSSNSDSLKCCLAAMQEDVANSGARTKSAAKCRHTFNVDAVGLVFKLLQLSQRRLNTVSNLQCIHIQNLSSQCNKIQALACIHARTQCTLSSATHPQPVYRPVFNQHLPCTSQVFLEKSLPTAVTRSFTDRLPFTMSNQLHKISEGNPCSHNKMRLNLRNYSWFYPCPLSR